MVSDSGLQALEFTDCLLDSPEFRENLNRHEKELEKTSVQIKRIIKEVKDLLTAAKSLSRAQRTLSKSLIDFNFECIGSTQTDDEQVIVDSLKQFGKLIAAIEDERDNMLARAHDQIVVPLESFRKEHIGGVKENKKKFEKKTAKFCQAQERFLSMSAKKPDNTIQEADASLGMLEREYLRESLSYVLRIQDVQERIKFEFVETLLGFMSGWLVFYHLGHEVAEDAKDYMTDLQHKVQKTRENFDETRLKAEELKAKYMDSKMKPETEFTKQGYLFLMEKKAFTVTWSKYYCTYKKTLKQFSMLPYNQISGRTESQPEYFRLISCTRRGSDFEKRFCFDLQFEDKPSITTFQALSEEDRKVWLNAMDGTEPTYLTPGRANVAEEYLLDDVGFAFAKKCIEVLENRGLEEEGLYRVGGVGTKISKLLTLGMDRKKSEKERLQFFNENEQYADILESKTIASALKHYLRNLNEPLMTYRYHNGFIAAAKQETRSQRISDVHTLVCRLPKCNFDMLEIIIYHLKTVALKSQKNRMSVFNLGVVFGPTLLRSVEETLAAILDIKFNNVVIEILIENFDKIFKTPGNKSLDYLTYSSPSELKQRNHNTYRNSRSSTMCSKPIRLVTKSDYIEPVMSSSLQNISNGMPIYQSSSTTSSGGKQSKSGSTHQIIYDTLTKTPSSLNQSTPSLIREVTLSPRDIALGRSGGSLGGGSETAFAPSSGTTVQSASNSLNPSPNHNSHSRDGCSGSIAVSMPSQVNQIGARGEKLLMHNRSCGDGIFSSSQKSNQSSPYYELIGGTSNNTSGHILQTQKQLLQDRINSTSSSNESVCSLSSRDLNHSQYRHPSQQKKQSTSAVQQLTSWEKQIQHNPTQIVSSNNFVINSILKEETSQIYSPKKIQRGYKSTGSGAGVDVIGFNRYKTNSPRNDIRVRTLYACLAENDGELSFEPNQIITNIRTSNEPGWLEGTLNGKSGLIPENYVELLP